MLEEMSVTAGESIPLDVIMMEGGTQIKFQVIPTIPSQLAGWLAA